MALSQQPIIHTYEVCLQGFGKCNMSGIGWSKPTTYQLFRPLPHTFNVDARSSTITRDKLFDMEPSLLSWVGCNFDQVHT